LSYPSRAVRTKDFLYIKNFEPERWPAGDPNAHISVGQYGDVDNSISKFTIMEMEGKSTEINHFELTFGKRPAEELYVLADDPYNLKNEAKNPKYKEELEALRNDLKKWMIETNDLRSKEPQTTYWDEVLYTPDYDSDNFDLKEKINTYQMLVRDGGRFKELDCK